MAQKSGCYRGGRKDLIVLRRCAQTGRVYLDSQKAEGNVPYGCATSNPPPSTANTMVAAETTRTILVLWRSGMPSSLSFYYE